MILGGKIVLFPFYGVHAKGIKTSSLTDFYRDQRSYWILIDCLDTSRPYFFFQKPNTSLFTCYPNLS